MNTWGPLVRCLHARVASSRGRPHLAQLAAPQPDRPHPGAGSPAARWRPPCSLMPGRTTVRCGSSWRSVPRRAGYGALAGLNRAVRPGRAQGGGRRPRANAVTASLTLSKKWSSPMRCRQTRPAQAVVEVHAGPRDPEGDAVHARRGPRPCAWRRSPCSRCPTCRWCRARRPAPGPRRAPRRRRPPRGSGRRWRTRSAWRRATTRTPGTCSALGSSAERCPAGRAREAPQHVQLRAGAQTDAVEDGEPDGDPDPLLHADQHHGEQRDRRQAELEEVEAGDGDQVPHAGTAAGRCRSGWRRAWPAARPRARRRRGCRTITSSAAPRAPACVRPPAVATAPVRGGLALTGNDPTRPADDAAGADPEEVAPGVDVVAALLGEGAGGRGRLGDDDQRHDGGQRSQASRASTRTGRSTRGGAPRS